MGNCDAVRYTQITTIAIELNNLDTIKKFNIMSTYVDDNFNLSTKNNDDNKLIPTMYKVIFDCTHEGNENGTHLNF